MRIGSTRVFVALCLAAPWTVPSASADPATKATPAVRYDADLARRVGADERGMRKYVLVVLKTGPTRVPDGAERDAMFAGHFANIERLSKAGQLALAGPFANDASGWRGLYVFAVDTIDEARRLVATDPVVSKGEMVPEFHEWYGSAAAMLLPEWHARLARPDAKTP